MSTATMNASEAAKVSTKPQVKPSAMNGPPASVGNGPGSGKTLDTARKQSASPVDGQNRKQPPPNHPKAWQGGTNPITQRASTPSTPNGTDKSYNKPNAAPPVQSVASTASKNSAELQIDRHANDRAWFLLAAFIGQDVTLTLKNGEQFTGVFSGASVDAQSKLQYVLKMVRRTQLSSHQQTNGVAELPDEYTGEGLDHMMVFDKEDTVVLAVKDVKPPSDHAMQNGSTSSFRTDIQISGRDPAAPRERELQRWVASPLDPNVDLSLEDSSGTGWDQFATNERLYGVQSTYDENLYTTTIDRNNPLFKQREADAARIAREIEGSTPADAHVAEERKRDMEGDDGLDEEDKYSGVKRDAAPLPKRTAGAYVPPSQRPISNTPTVPGAPYDPAIISSQLARPARASSPNDTIDQVTTTDTVTSAQSSSAETPASATDTQSSDQNVLPPTAATKKPDNYMRDVTDSFKQFASNEKLRIRQVQEAKRSNARAEKNVKLNDLKKFAENFKLKSRVPDDLVPILAKDREKQLQIQTKAEVAAKEEEVRSKEREKNKPIGTSPGPSAALQPNAPPLAVDQRLNMHRSRASQNMPGAPTLPGPIPNSRQNGGPARVSAGRFGRPHIEPLPANLRDLHKPPTTRQESPISPSNAPKLNVNAKAFEFRPGANTFMPTGTSPSPQRLPDRSTAVVQSQNFFEGTDAAPASNRKKMDDTYNSLAGLKPTGAGDDQKKALAQNGGIPRPFQTPPTWRAAEENINKTIRDVLPKQSLPAQAPSPMHTPNPSHIAHGQQFPPHFQQQQMGAGSQRGHYMGPAHHPHGPSNFDPTRMQQFGPNGSVQSSPRVPPMQMAFNNQMPGMPQFGGQQMPYPGMSPSMQYRQIPPNAQGMMMMGQPQGQMPPPMPQAPFPRGPNGFQPAMIAGGVPMSNQPSAGFPGGSVPPQGGYSPMPPHAQPHMPHNMPGGPGGYAGSPRMGGHMMPHGGSHPPFPQGSPMPPHMAGPPPFVGSPGQPHHYHVPQQSQQQQRFPQMTPRQQAALPHHHGSPGIGMGQGDEGK